jgi:thioredoxin 1
MSAFQQLIHSDKPVLVDFYAHWCGPCKALSPEVEKVARNMKDRVKVVKVDIDKNQKVAQDLHISSVPTLMIFKKGKIVWRKSGMMGAHQIENEINKFV